MVDYLRRNGGDIKIAEDNDCPIEKWGRMHRAYLEKTNPPLLNHLILASKLHTYLAKMMESEGVIEDLKRRLQWEWIRTAMNSIVRRAEEVVSSEMINA